MATVLVAGEPMQASPIHNPETSPHALFLAGTRLGGIVTHVVDHGSGNFPPRLVAGSAFRPLTSDSLVRRGRIVSATRVEQRSGAHILALVDLDGGGRLMARLRTEVTPAALVGRQATLASERRDGEPFLTFVPSDLT